MKVRGFEFKEETHTCLNQTGASSSLDLKLNGNRWPMLDDPWLLLDAQWWAVGHWRSMVEAQCSMAAAGGAMADGQGSMADEIGSESDRGPKYESDRAARSLPARFGAGGTKWRSEAKYLMLRVIDARA